MDDDIWVATPTLTTTQPLVPINGDLWDINAPPIPVKPPAPKIIDVGSSFFFPLQTFILSHHVLNTKNKQKRS